MPEGALRVMTYNIRNGRGTDDRIDLDRIAEVIASFDPDVLALQEVDCGRQRSGALDQAGELARRLGMEASFAACVEDGSERYGIATLSRLPLVSARQVMLPHRAGARRSEPRCALVTRHTWGDAPAGRRTIDLVNTHLSILRGERPAQVAAIAGALGTDAEDLVIAGDLNCRAGSRTRLALSRGLRSAAPWARSWPSRLPLLPLDHILVRGDLDVLRAGAWTAPGARRASDHLPVVAELVPARGAA
ncbi:MAG TPA: endonuclease/exonuclease/phosphatase family protein [Kofleriaceae bacterium]|nr:endonuclease/exonuclease/phosphatase family protein [Kofleriaceae bacterium]